MPRAKHSKSVRFTSTLSPVLLDAVPQIRDNSLLQELQRRRAELSVQYTDALNQYGPNFPKVLRIEAQMKDLDEQMTKERKGIIVQLKSDYNEAKAREDLLSERLDQQKVEANAMSEKMVQYNILRRDADANKALYEGLLTKLKEAGISEGLKSSNIRIVDPATIPSVTIQAGKGTKYCPVLPGRFDWRDRDRSAARISGQYGQVSR